MSSSNKQEDMETESTLKHAVNANDVSLGEEKGMYS